MGGGVLSMKVDRIRICTTDHCVEHFFRQPFIGGENKRRKNKDCFLSFFIYFRGPNLITGLSGWRAPDWPPWTQEPVPLRSFPPRAAIPHWTSAWLLCRDREQPIPQWASAWLLCLFWEWSHTGRGANHMNNKDIGTNHVRCNVSIYSWFFNSWIFGFGFVIPSHN